MIKKIVLAGGCFWGEKWDGTHFARPCQQFLSLRKKSDKVYSSFKE